MRTTEFKRGEIEIKRWFQFFAVPSIGSNELLIVGALLVPVGQERTGEVDTFSIPAFRDHVDLPSYLLLINLLRLLWVCDVENANLAVSEAGHEQGFIIGTQADVDRENPALGVTDRCHVFCLPFVLII